MKLPTVALVGRPNVGKSTLFNKLVGAKVSIIEDTPGVTRDRIYAEATWRGVDFTLIDTGGIEPESEDVIISQMRNQADMAISIADVILFVTDLKQGVTEADKEIALMLKKSKKPIILVCNKSDNYGEPPAELYEFYNYQNNFLFLFQVFLYPNFLLIIDKKNNFQQFRYLGINPWIYHL